jgi:nucleoside-diphosphate-sugar epimerase
MRIVIAGGHGQIAMRLYPLLKARGHSVRGIIRNPAQADDLKEAGAEPLLCDLESTDDIAPFLGSADAILFAAGAGPGSGAARKQTMDRDGARKLIDVAERNGIGRFVMISAMGAEQPRGDDVFQAYLLAKAEADDALRQSQLDWTIVRPGRLTNDPGRGRVRVGPQLPRGEIPRADVAAVLVHVLETPGTIHRQFDVTAGDREIADAVASIGASSALHRRHK